MSEYLNFYVLQEIQTSIEKLVADESKSQEIRQSSEMLSHSMVPCFDELRRSAERMKNFLQVCLADLERAEDVWRSKPAIMGIPSSSIWNQIGELSGLDMRISQLVERYKSAVIAEVNHQWKNELDEIKKTSFEWDKNQRKFRKGNLMLFEKDELIENLYKKVERFIEKLTLGIGNRMHLLFAEINSIEISFLVGCIDCYDKRNKEKLHKELTEKASDVEAKLKSFRRHMPPSYPNAFDFTIANPLGRMAIQSTFAINLLDFEGFERSICCVVDDLVHSIFEDRRKLLSKAIARIISFYNDLLEKQARYRQETPEQRQAEKAWIDRQREQLQKVQANIEQVLGSAG